MLIFDLCADEDEAEDVLVVDPLGEIGLLLMLSERKEGKGRILLLPV